MLGEPSSSCSVSMVVGSCCFDDEGSGCCVEVEEEFLSWFCWYRRAWMRVCR